MMRVLDLFSAAAGGWSLGLHRAGFVTVAACEIVKWRRILYSENFPHVRLYEDIRDLTAARLLSDLGFLPDIVVGSPPCQDISVANTKGKGVEGERSGLYFEAIRIVGECRPRWFALENSAHLRTRGADRVLGELEALGYAVESCVVAAAHVGANHERKRSWLIGFDPEQLADTRLTIPTGWIADGGRIGTAQGDEGIRSPRRVPQHDIAHSGGRNERLEPRRGGRQIGAGSLTTKGHPMPRIGTFARNEDGFFGRIRSLILDAELAILPAEESDAENAPNHRVLLFGNEVGAAWDRAGEKAGAYLSITIDDPSLPQPIRARLFRSGADDNEWVLHWSRRKQRSEQD